MPKQLDQAGQRLLNAADYILKNEGYQALTIRRLASECKVAVGTVYNYFENKEDLTARVISRDWLETLEKMNVCVQSAESFPEGAAGLYRLIAAFDAVYDHIWMEYAQKESALSILTGRHRLLRGQIAALLSQLAEHTGQRRLIGSADMLAECILAAVNQEDLSEQDVRRLMELATGADTSQ